MEKEIICTDLNGKQISVPVSKLTFRPSVYGVIIEDGKILLSKQWGDGYDFPGGGIDIGESIDEALKREVKEETGLDVEIGRIVHCESSFFKFRFEDKCVQSILMYYLCKRVGGELTVEYFDEHEKEYADMPEWINIEDVDNVRIRLYNSADSIKIIKAAIELQGL
jgi:ADP-ribose pyrophosphatase YjhB (NUDIX family)